MTRLPSRMTRLPSRMTRLPSRMTRLPSSMASRTDARAEPASSVDAVVVGAGPGGSATAAELARAGHRVLLLDRAAFPRHKACSEYMSPETVRLLDRLGVLPALDAAGAP